MSTLFRRFFQLTCGDHLTARDCCDPPGGTRTAAVGAQGRREFGDVDTYDFKLQCSGVWQEYMDLSFSGEQARGARECPAGMMAYGWRSYRGFVKRGDRDRSSAVSIG